MTFRPTIRSQSDLEDAWRTLMGPLGFSRETIWLMLISKDDQPFPHLTQIDGAVEPPAGDELAGFADLVGELCSRSVPGGRVAFLRSRPGPRGLTPRDRAWARAFYDVGRLADVPVDVVHRACNTDLVPIPMDDVLPDSAA